MSLAGKRSTQGDEYQLRIALYWLIQLLDDDSIEGIQAESTGVPGEGFPVDVDDVVVKYKDGRYLFIQAKKNQPQHKNWSLSDKVLQEELRKAGNQLAQNEQAEVRFYSRSPFGELKILVEACMLYADFDNFNREPAKNHQRLLLEVSGIMDLSPDQAFPLIKRISFGSPLEYDDWDKQNRRDLALLVSSPDDASPILERFLQSHEASLRNTPTFITREHVLRKLEERGIIKTPARNEQEILDAFAYASTIGRQWIRTIANKRIDRPELQDIINHIDAGNRTILVTGGPGNGKTCLLLDLAEQIEKSQKWRLLFIKGDYFDQIITESELKDKGLPEDIVGQCARLAEYGPKVIIVIDSLDVLSLSRNHSSLKVFLGLLDRLSKLKGISVVTACRVFDLKYDPLLRERVWDCQISLGLFDYDTVVKSFLTSWGVDESSLSPELKNLLRVPQNLRIFERLAGDIPVKEIFTPYDLYSLFLKTVVTQKDSLGDQVISDLQEMAKQLAHERGHKLPRFCLKLSENQIRQLCSEEILYESAPDMLSFTHQEIGDCLLVQEALSRNQSLLGYILEHPPFPFIRPTVRTFLFYLRAHQPNTFRKQVIAVLSHDKIAYHLKRLVCESLAEIIPRDDDWRLVRRIFHDYPDLFRRFFGRTNGDGWFYLLTQKWLPLAEQSPNAPVWVLMLTNHLNTWANRFPIEVIALWRKVISYEYEWGQEKNPVQEIIFSLTTFSSWQSPGIRELLEIIIEKSNHRRGFLGKHIGAWVLNTNTGDDLLWKYITYDLHDNDVNSFTNEYLGESLHLLSFPVENFLAQRLVESEALLTLVIDQLMQWCTGWMSQLPNDRIRSFYLNATSWKDKHLQSSMAAGGHLATLLNSLEEALKHQASKNDAWWQKYEPSLRHFPEQGIRYLLFQAYQANILDNIPGIEAQLVDRKLLVSKSLDFELGELINASYPFLTNSGQDSHQELLFTLANQALTEDQMYSLLIKIPCIYRKSETQAFIDQWEILFGNISPLPKLSSYFGQIRPPFSHETMMSLSDQSIIDLLAHYHSDAVWDTDILVGGREQVASVLALASSIDPERFLLIFPTVVNGNFHRDFPRSIADGIANHLRYLYGNVKPQIKWQPVDPVPDANLLAKDLLKLLERHPVLWENERMLVNVVSACCSILDDAESAERLTLILYSIFCLQGPDRHNRIGRNDIHAITYLYLNAAESAALLCNSLLQKDQSLPELLPCFLLQITKTPLENGTFAAVLLDLPYLIHKAPDLGWSIFDVIIEENQSDLWVAAERVLYYNYRADFQRIATYLDRIYADHMEPAGGVWGRISALACLAGHIGLPELFDRVPSGFPNAHRGMAQVFGENLSTSENRQICLDGLRRILAVKNLDGKVLREVANCFGNATNYGLIDIDFATLFLLAVSRGNIHSILPDFSKWMNHSVRQNPRSAVPIFEILISKLQELGDARGLWETEPLIVALAELLREADEFDEEDLIQQSIRFQDQFLVLNVPGIEDLLNAGGTD